MWRDIKHGFRQLRGKKLFGMTVIVLVALGIGSNTVIFSFVNSLLLRTLPVREPENLYLLQKDRVRQVRSDTSFFYQQFEAVDRMKAIFSAAVAEQSWAGNSFQVFSVSATTTNTPEPATILLLLCSMTPMGALMWRGFSPIHSRSRQSDLPQADSKCRS